MDPRRARLATVLLLVIACGYPAFCLAQRERPRELLRDLVGGLVSENPERLEAEAAAVRDVAEARRLYEILQSRHAETEPGRRAALWLGRYYYGTGMEEEALRYFERARGTATDPQLAQEAIFWCDQTRLVAGREPVGVEDGAPAGGFWGTLRGLIAVDRLVRQGRAHEVETRLLALQGDDRRIGLSGLLLARWGDLLRLQGREVSDCDALQSLLRTSRGLPECLHLERRLEATTRPEAGELWSIEFGATTDAQEARAQQGELQGQGLDVRIDETPRGDRTIYQIRMGEFGSRGEIDSVVAGMSQETAAKPLIVRIR